MMYWLSIKLQMKISQSVSEEDKWQRHAELNIF